MHVHMHAHMHARTPAERGPSVYVYMHAEANSNQNVVFKQFCRHTLEEKNKTKPQAASRRSSICHCLRVPGCEAPAFLFSSPIIITHISCRSLLQIFIGSSVYAIRRTRRSYSESAGETGFSEEKGDKERERERMKVSHIDRMTQERGPDKNSV